MSVWGHVSLQDCHVGILSFNPQIWGKTKINNGKHYLLVKATQDPLCCGPILQSEREIHAHLVLPAFTSRSLMHIAA